MVYVDVLLAQVRPYRHSRVKAAITGCRARGLGEVVISGSKASLYPLIACLWYARLRCTCALNHMARAAVALASQGKVSEALALVAGPLGAAALRLPSERLQLRAVLSALSGDLGAASELLREGLRLNPDDWGALLLLLDCMLPHTPAQGSGAAADAQRWAAGMVGGAGKRFKGVTRDKPFVPSGPSGFACGTVRTYAFCCKWGLRGRAGGPSATSFPNLL